MTSRHREPQWLDWAKRLQAIAQNGLAFNDNAFDIERYGQVRQLAAEIIATHSNLPVGELITLFAGEEGYCTPKVDVRGAAFCNGKLLMVREASDGGWTLPGGWADPCASPAENVAREMKEESGFDVSVQRLAAVYDRSLHPHDPPFPHHIYKMFFLCKITGGAATESHETTAVDFFTEDALPPLSISRVTPWQLQRMFAFHRDATLSVDCD